MTDDFHARYTAWRSALDKQMTELVTPANKKVLFDELTAYGITFITVRFDGEGDSGQIEEVIATKSDLAAGEITEPVDLPGTSIAVMSPAGFPYGGAVLDDPTSEEQSVSNAIETICYAFLEQTHPGWENNDGAYGTFTFDVAERTIELDFNERFTDTNNYGHSF